MPASKSLTASLEDYLEAIYHVAAEKGAARANPLHLMVVYFPGAHAGGGGWGGWG